MADFLQDEDVTPEEEAFFREHELKLPTDGIGRLDIPFEPGAWDCYLRDESALPLVAKFIALHPAKVVAVSMLLSHQAILRRELANWEYPTDKVRFYEPQYLGGEKKRSNEVPASLAFWDFKEKLLKEKCGLLVEGWACHHKEQTESFLRQSKAQIVSLVGGRPDGADGPLFEKRGRNSEEGADWREHSQDVGQLSSEPREYIVQDLVPARALTFIVAPSFNCKTWLALSIAAASAFGRQTLFDRFLVKKVPVFYHVPEMDERLFREYCTALGISKSEDFLCRPMEAGRPWMLTEPMMVESSKGRLVFLDTQGYFNSSDDTNSYSQQLGFARDCQSLLTQGCLGIVGLYHPPKYAKQEDLALTLENQIAGSVALGGILRSCVAMRNIKEDLNDKDPLVYVQGLKNPGLRPFLLEHIPLQMKEYDCRYLSDLLKGGDEMERVEKMFEQGIPYSQIRVATGISNGKLTKMNKDWKRRGGKVAEVSSAEVTGNLDLKEDEPAF